MNTLFIIGGIAVFAGITFMTVLYYETAADLREARSEIRLLKARLQLEKSAKKAHREYEISDILDNDVEFGGF